MITINKDDAEQFCYEVNRYISFLGREDWPAGAIVDSLLEDSFGYTTYDSGKGSTQEFLGRCLIEAYFAAKNNPFYYFKDSDERRLRYIIGAQKLLEFNILEWDTSIRGAWIDSPRPWCTKELLDAIEKAMQFMREHWEEYGGEPLYIVEKEGKE